MKILPESMLKRMTPEDRKSIGQVSAEEAAHIYRMRNERQQHAIFRNWLQMEGMLFQHSSPVKRSTIEPAGFPDFQVFYIGRSLFLEFKRPEGRLSEDQINVHRQLLRAGHYVQVPRSAAEAIEITKQWRGRLIARATQAEHAAKRPTPTDFLK
jgi:hypothetical protein